MSIVVVNDATHLGSRSWGTLVRAKLWLISVVTIAVILVFAVSGSLLAPYNPVEQLPQERLLGPWTRGSRGLYVFGTDELGRDVLSRTIQGARLTLFIALMSTLIGAVIGVIALASRHWNAG